MKKGVCDKHVMNALVTTFSSLQQYASRRIDSENSKLRRKLRRGKANRSEIQEKCGSYPFIPHPAYSVLCQLIYTFNYLKGKYNSRPLSFLDAGCGIGNIMMLAMGVGFDAHGLEFDPVTIEFARGINPWWQRIREQNILTCNDYGKFDVVYYFCPIANVKQEEFEKRVEDQMTVGSLLIANMKRNNGIRKDRRFRYHHRRNIHSIYEKIKG